MVLEQIVNAEGFEKRLLKTIKKAGSCGTNALFKEFPNMSRSSLAWAIQRCMDQGKIEFDINLQLRVRQGTRIKSLTFDQLCRRVIWYVNRFGPCVGQDILDGIRGALKSDIQRAIMSAVMSRGIKVLPDLKLAKASPRKVRRT